jgi:uncharacterized membrane protein
LYNFNKIRDFHLIEINDYKNGLFDPNIFYTFFLVTTIIGIFLCLITFVYSFKVKNNLKRKDFVGLIVLAVFELLIGATLGGIIVLIGSIMGLVRNST